MGLLTRTKLDNGFHNSMYSIQYIEMLLDHFTSKVGKLGMGFQFIMLF